MTPKSGALVHIDVEVDCPCGGKLGGNHAGAIIHTLPTCKAYDEIDVEETSESLALVELVQEKLDASKRS